MNDYTEIKNPTKGFYKEKGSKFISYLFPVFSEEEVKEKLVKIKKIEHSARHHCYAYIINSDKSEQRVNDDGEPSSTAGMPILRQIQSNNLTNTLIIVARYFGGIKLGKNGLIRSYKQAAADSISNGIILKKTTKEEYEVYFKFQEMNNVMRLIKENKLEVVNTNFKTDCSLIFTVSKNNSDSIVTKFKKNYKLKLKYLKTI
tara:strand:- start:8285 stop:8890 length:606 start_codon:yes stop_codon:yes gene_type:complete